MVNTIWFQLDLIRFRKYFSVCNAPEREGRYMNGKEVTHLTGKEVGVGIEPRHDIGNAMVPREGRGGGVGAHDWEGGGGVEIRVDPFFVQPDFVQSVSSNPNLTY